MSGDNEKSGSGFNDVDHLIQELKLDGVHYREFGSRDQQPKLKLVSARRAERPVLMPQAEDKAPVPVPFSPVVPQTVAAPQQPVVSRMSDEAPTARTELPPEHLQATFSRLIARAPLPPARKLNIDLKLAPRERDLKSQPAAKEEVSLKTLFGKLGGADAARTGKRSG